MDYQKGHLLPHIVYTFIPVDVFIMYNIIINGCNSIFEPFNDCL